MNDNSGCGRWGCLAAAVLGGLLLLSLLWSCRLQPPFAPPPPAVPSAATAAATPPYAGWPGEAAWRWAYPAEG